MIRISAAIHPECNTNVITTTGNFVPASANALAYPRRIPICKNCPSHKPSRRATWATLYLFGIRTCYENMHSRQNTRPPHLQNCSYDNAAASCRARVVPPIGLRPQVQLTILNPLELPSVVRTCIITPRLLLVPTDWYFS